MSPRSDSRQSETKREQAFRQFLEDFPEYEHTRILDELREREYGRLDENGQIYLDYTGGGLYAESQITRHTSLVRFLRTIEHTAGKSAGAVRVSVGLVTNFADAYYLMEFLKGFRDRPSDVVGDVTFAITSCRVIRDGS